MAIIGRKAEIEELQRYFSSGRPEFLVVYGRRRVGKTYLIREFFRDDFFFYTTGVSRAELQSDAGVKQNLGRFDNALKSKGFSPNTPSATWMDAFDNLTDFIKQAPSGRKVIFIDEMPWLDTQRSGFLTALEYFWNAFASARRDILLIACGSAASWMTKKVLMNTGGLYNRFTGILHIEPFTLSECEAYFQEKNIKIDRYSIAEAYMVFGGIPYYLDYWNGKYSAAQNIDRILFFENAPLKYEFDRLFQSLFGSAGFYESVIHALAAKRCGLTRNDLTDIVKQNGGVLTSALRDLETSGFIRHYSAYSGDTHGSKKTGGLYQLTDNFSLFCMTFERELKSQNHEFWSTNTNTPKINSWRGYAFEQVVLQHIKGIKKALGIAGVGAGIYSWKNQEAQIDLIIDRNDRIINLCEIKFSNTEFEITKRVYENLTHKTRIFESETKTRKPVHMTMITTYGIKRNAYSSFVSNEVCLDDLFSE